MIYTVSTSFRVDAPSAATAVEAFIRATSIGQGAICIRGPGHITEARVRHGMIAESPRSCDSQLRWVPTIIEEDEI